MAVDPARAKSLFLNASDLADPAERAAYLDRECGDDAELRGRVEALLIADGPSGPGPEPEATDVFRPTLDEAIGATQIVAPETPPESRVSDPDDGPATVGATGTGGADGTLADDAADSPADRLADFTPGRVVDARYTLLGVLGEGGMGTVYLAEQTRPVKRQVALKLIRVGMDSRGVLARFDAERQALAMMDHPNIASVFDGGVTEDGQPFFVMEYVRGVPITDYCDRHRLTVDARLQLFVAACQAVQHAHQKGIIHRDLKPSNVLVSEVDGRPTPKVIDFGVAKATGFDLTDQSLGDTGAIVGTPTYMSPEQADPSSMDVDTRTDVYALGVILYELLAGATPLDATQFKRGALLEMLRMVREVDPSKPSTKVSTSESLPSIAANRGIDPGQLKRALAGDLDWIVMKALEKDRTRRYETANGFASDILRHLASEPVLAAPPSRSYRARKFVRKHRAGVIAAGLVMVALLAGITGTTLGLFEARRQEGLVRGAERRTREERDRALMAEARAGQERDRAVKAQAQARSEAEKVKAINDFLTTDLLIQAEPANNAEEDHVTLLTVLDRAAEKVGERFKSQPELEFPLRASIANTYHGLASWEKAERQQRARVELARRPGAEPAELYAAEGELAHILRHRGRVDEEMLAMARSASEGLKRVLGPEHPATLATVNNLAGAYQAAGKLDLALPLFEETLKLLKAKLGPEHPDTLGTMNNLAGAYQAAGKLDLALPLFEETLKLFKAKLGPEHPDTLTSMGNLARAYQQAGKLDLALPLFEKTLELRRGKLGPENSDTLTSMNNLARAYWSLRQFDKSIPLFEEKLKIQEKTLGRDHPEALRTVANLGVNYKDAGRIKEAIPLLQEGYRAARKHPSLRVFGAALLDAYTKEGEHSKAADLIQEQLTEARKTLPTDGPQLAGILAQIGMLKLQAKAFPEAEPLLRECLAIREKTEPDAWTMFNTQSMLGGALLGQKKYADAEPLLRKGYEGMKRREKSIPTQASTRLPDALDRLIELYSALGKPIEVKTWQAERAKYPAAQPQKEPK